MSRASLALRLGFRTALGFGRGLGGDAARSSTGHATAALEALQIAEAHLCAGRPRNGWLQLTRNSAGALPKVHQRWVASAALPAEDALQADTDDLVITDAAAEQLQHLLKESVAGERFLRLTVEAGGCSGFSYKFELDRSTDPTDRIFEHRGVQFVTDDVSVEFLRGATVDYVQELIKSTFEVTHNPNASGGCGCGSSFAPK